MLSLAHNTRKRTPAALGWARTGRVVGGVGVNGAERAPLEWAAVSSACVGSKQPATLATAALCVDAVAALLFAIVADRFGMRLGPNIRS
jgi:hypothetical protein